MTYILSQLSIPAPAETEFYREPTWKPRALLPTADALSSTFWPASPKAVVDYVDPNFAAERLPAPPAPGIHPRVLLTPEDLAAIQAKIALGEKAPAEFRVMWERVTKTRSAFYALAAGDDELGRGLAMELVKKVHSLEGKMPKLEAQPDQENLWYVERSLIAAGDPDPPTEIWSLTDYDYLHKWMTPEERAETEKLIVRVTAGRISNFLAYPDHWMINNHQGFGMEYIRLLLLVEGQPGFDAAIFKASAHKVRAMLDWYLSPDGMSYESIKGWLNTSVIMAVARREPDLLKHSHLRAKMQFAQHAMHWQDGRWQIREEMRASAAHVIWMMHYFHPRDLGMDRLYAATLTTHEFLVDANARWPDPVGVTPELLLLFAEDGLRDEQGKRLDWTDQKRIDALQLPLTWKDDQRGYVMTRNTWDREDLLLGFTCKQDFYYGGHEGSENNRLVLWADGINWIRSSDLLAVKETFLQNMLTVDGKGLTWPPAPGVWLGVQETPAGLIAAGDGKVGYSFGKVMQVHPLDFPSAKLPYYAPFAEANYDLTRDQQVAFHPGTVKWNDGYAHTDYGPWSGETRLVESYRENNPMEQAYRTVYLARGKHPYVLVLDDARKDDQEHYYEWNITLPEGIDLLDNVAPEIVFQSVPPGPERQNDLLLGRASTPRDEKTGRPNSAAGDPLFLVRTLWRNSPHGFPVPRFEKINVEPQVPYGVLGHITIPAISDSPEFRVLLYPHRQGDPLPETSWNTDRTQLTVKIADVTDVYRFGKSDGGRTVFSVERNGAPVIRSEAAPARPVLIVRGHRYNADELRTTRMEYDTPVYKFDKVVEVKLERPAAPAYLTYTLDGSEPTTASPRYEKPLQLTTSATLSARVIDPQWPAGTGEGKVLRAEFTLIPPAKGLQVPPAGARPGLLARVYEKKTVMWNDRGFFEAGKAMLPDLDLETPVVSTAATGFKLPYVNPTRPVPEQAKGFYRFTGWYHAAEQGVYGLAVDSSGPVLLKLGGQTVIASTGVFHQQQAVRRGDAVLEAGWHALELIVCDPLLWNVSTVGEMPFSVTIQREGGEAQEIPAAGLCMTEDGVALAEPPQLPWSDAQKQPAWLETGADLLTYEREKKLRDADYLDIDALTPYRRERVDHLEPNVRPAIVRVYEGWYRSPEDGVYRFDLPARKEERSHLGDLRAAFLNQLRIDGQVVVQRGVTGRRTDGRIGLKAGWHFISLRLGSSSSDGTITTPDGQTQVLTAAMLERPVQVSILPMGQIVEASTYEIFGPTEVTLKLPAGRDGKIRYTLDGSEPTAGSAEFTGTLNLDRSAVITAAAFLPDGSVVAHNVADFRLVTVPEAGLLGSPRFERWDGKPGMTELDGLSAVWIAPGSERTAEGLSVYRQAGQADFKPSLDINVSRGPTLAAVKLSGLKMRDNAITVGLWFKSDTANGKLFGKDGISAFGKSYRTVSCSLNNGQVQALPGKLAGGVVKPGEWTHVALTADANGSRIYVNGVPVASGVGSKTLVTDALDFLSSHPATVGEIRVYERVLTERDIRQWYHATMRQP